ncbi:SDR family NAD(P)-dependent oxidoreductase [Alteromonadaceae bacterium M269]|nr:SDR family NAD(P)-dependent oxidoreductase [Alteromonadaceae bacterium M269]
MATDATLILGAGDGLSASLARRFSESSEQVLLAARNINKLEPLCLETKAQAYACDVTAPLAVKHLFDVLDKQNVRVKTLIYNVGAYTRGAIDQIVLEEAKQVLLANAFGAMIVAQEASKRMIKSGAGVLLFTGASAGIKGYPQSSPFAMGKFALRGLCQSLSRELAPQGIHVAHFIIDGLIYSEKRGAPFDDLDSTLHPDDIADTYFHIAQQNRNCWTYEVELRPFCETF